MIRVVVLQSGAEQGHLACIYSGTIMRPTSPPPTVPSDTVAGCSACRNAPDGPYPATNTGPRGTREHFGSQWHTGTVELAAIQAAAG